MNNTTGIDCIADYYLLEPKETLADIYDAFPRKEFCARVSLRTIALSNGQSIFLL